MKKIIFATLAAFFITMPLLASAQEKTAPDTTFQARVTEVVKEQDTVLPDGTKSFQQQLKLIGLEGEYKDKEVFYNGVGDIDIIKKNIYKVGDKVLVLSSPDDQGGYHYYVTDYVRTRSLLYLAVIFLVTLFAVGGWKGVRSLISLVLSFAVIMGYIVHQILDGGDPVLVTIVGSLIILFSVIYLTEGITKEAHIGVVSVFASLLLTIFLSWFFVDFAMLSGLATEDTGFLVGLGTKAINFKGLLLAGIIIGALGVLDDVVISQVSTVKELYKTDPDMSRYSIFKKAYRVGISHISSMTNTLFLAYSGASLALLILFSSGQSGYNTWTQAINNEMLATEIVRTLAGSVGLILAVPISTSIAVWWFKRR